MGKLVSTGSFWVMGDPGCLAKGSGAALGTLGGVNLSGWNCEGFGAERAVCLRADAASKLAAHPGLPALPALKLLFHRPFSKKQPTRQLRAARIATPNVFVPRVCEIPQRHRSSPT